MKVLIAIKGSEDEAFFQRVAATLPLAEATVILLVHVVDTGARDELQFGRERHFGRRPIPRDRSEELARAEEDRAQAGLRYARQALLDAGVSADAVREEALRGKPNEMIRDLAERESIDVVVVRARPGKPGPHSLGKTARFLVDHAPHAVLVIRP